MTTDRDPIKELKLDWRNFLKFHVRKGKETLGELKGLISIRTNTIDNCIANNKPILITVEGEEGVMLLFPEDFNKGIIVKTSQGEYGPDSNKYRLARIVYRPTNELTIKNYNDLVSLQKELNSRINSIKKDIKLNS